jgi:DNA-binding MarR family transcriptional regulator
VVEQTLVPPPEAVETPPAVRAWTRLLRAQASTTRILSAALQADHGLTINDYEALLVLARSDGRRLKRIELARSLLLTPSGVTRLLDGLERAGLVERAACPGDLRVTYAQLTEAGNAKVEAASCGHVASVRSLMEAHLSPYELKLLADMLSKLPGVDDSRDVCPG